MDKYFIYYTAGYDDTGIEEFTDANDALAFIAEYSKSYGGEKHGFYYKLFKGRELKPKVVEVETKFVLESWE